MRMIIIVNWPLEKKRVSLIFSFLFYLTICCISNKVSSQEYFQQEVNYKINVLLNDKNHELNSFESIEYINNSPDTLDFIFFHLWPNAYSGNNTALAKQLSTIKGKARLFKDPELRGFIDSLDFKVGGIRVQWNLQTDNPDICKLILNEAVYPGDTIVITTPFFVKIPKGVSRLGHTGESYQISQWYPKPAVYDNSGWHEMPYLDQGEFYSEFGSFNVSITLPENYTVGATGDLQDESELERLELLSTDTIWENTAGLIVPDDIPPSSDQFKTLHYTGNNIHDFAWFADKRFHVLKGIVNLPESGRSVTTWVMFTDNQADLWKYALDYVNNSITYFSEKIGDYPYNSFTAVQSTMNAGEGMEYPGLTVIDRTLDAYSLEKVLAHEICHNWFYSSLGSNERKYPFMDEGITSLYDNLYMNMRYPEKKMWELLFKKEKLAKFLQIEKLPVRSISEIVWLVQARQNLEQPLNIAAPDYTFINYGAIIYSKAYLGFDFLRSYLGDSVFDEAMHEYYRIWKSKHPRPEDLQDIFEAVSEKDLKWFFRDLIGTTKRIDYKVLNINNQQLLIKNNGEIASPFNISGLENDSVVFEKWTEGFYGKKWIDIPKNENYSKIIIDPGHIMPETFRLNNDIRKSGIFRKADPVRPQLLFAIEDPGKRSLNYIPVINWTRENGFMPGIAFNNGNIFTKPVEFFVMPFYSFKSSSPAGFGKISYNLLPWDKIIRMATFSLEYTQFGAPGNQNYHKAKAGLDISFRNHKMANQMSQRIYGNYSVASDLFQILNFEKADMLSYYQFGYVIEKGSVINPFTFSTYSEFNKSYRKASVEFNYRFSYRGFNGLDIRLFAGKMLKKSTDASFYGFAPAGRSGREQYLFQGTYPDRFGVFPNTFWSRQMTLSEGGLVSPINDSLGYSNQLISLSLVSSLPGFAGKLPVKPFINLLLNDHSSGNGWDSPIFYEAGFKAGIWNLFEVYFPILMSGNIESGAFKNRIRIVLTLDAFSKLRLKR